MTPPRDESDAFEAYRYLILETLKEIKQRLDRIEREVSIIKVENRALEIKAGLWGALAGAIPTALAALLLWLRSTP